MNTALLGAPTNTGSLVGLYTDGYPHNLFSVHSPVVSSHDTTTGDRSLRDPEVEGLGVGHEGVDLRLEYASSLFRPLFRQSQDDLPIQLPLPDR